MKPRTLFRAAACALAWAPLAAIAADWRPVPGAPDVAIDLASWQQERARVMVWVRWPGRGPWAQEAPAVSARGARVHRTAAYAEFDCSRRAVRALALSAYDSGGAPVFMSSLPQPWQAVAAGDLGWTYDAVCEAARASHRA